MTKGERFVQFAHMRERDRDGLFTAVVWDRELEATSRGQAATRPKARKLAINAARVRADQVADQVARLFALTQPPTGSTALEGQQ